MEKAKRARAACLVLTTKSADERNQAIRNFKDSLKANRSRLEKANEEDCRLAAIEVAAGRMSPTIFERLSCTGPKFNQMITGIEGVIALDDPVGRCTLSRQISTDLNLYRVTCPIGVILVIFESRPEAAVAILTLCLKSGNASILKGGCEAKHTLQTLHDIVQECMKSNPDLVPADSVQFCGSREEAAELFKLDMCIDLVVPRGSNEMVQLVKNSTTIPVLGHAKGLCSIYVDEDADLKIAAEVANDAKVQYPAACNAMETLLVHEQVLPQFFAEWVKVADKDIKYRTDEKCMPYLPPNNTTLAKPDDYFTEFLDKIIAIKAVKDFDDAIQHINRHSSGHTDVIITSNAKTADRYMSTVDSSGVYCNCSSRFADGFRYGFGAEVGISTNRIHARGPVGLEGLVTYRYRMYGKGQCVRQYSTTVPEAERLTYDHKALPQEVLQNAEDVAKYQSKFFH